MAVTRRLLGTNFGAKGLHDPLALRAVNVPHHGKRDVDPQQLLRHPIAEPLLSQQEAARHGKAWAILPQRLAGRAVQLAVHLREQASSTAVHDARKREEEETANPTGQPAA
eukprot:12927522-Prorocentrum_lima.AAC.1